MITKKNSQNIESENDDEIIFNYIEKLPVENFDDL
jgi:hypothetical protein